MRWLHVFNVITIIMMLHIIGESKGYVAVISAESKFAVQNTSLPNCLNVIHN